jgi:hypothetical protein
MEYVEHLPHRASLKTLQPVLRTAHFHLRNASLCVSN